MIAVFTIMKVYRVLALLQSFVKFICNSILFSEVGLELKQDLEFRLKEILLVHNHFESNCKLQITLNANLEPLFTLSILL